MSAVRYFLSLEGLPSILCLKHWYFSAEDSWQPHLLNCSLHTSFSWFIFKHNKYAHILVKTGSCPFLGLSLKHSLFNHSFTKSSILLKDLVISLSAWPDYCIKYGCLSSRINVWLHFCDRESRRFRKKLREKNKIEKGTATHRVWKKWWENALVNIWWENWLEKHLVDNYYENCPCHCQLFNKFTTLIYWKSSNKQYNNIIIDMFKKLTTLIWRNFWNILYETKTLKCKSMENQKVDIEFDWHKPSKSRNTIIITRDPNP